MNEEEANFPGPLDESNRITHEQFTKFLIAKAPEKPCPECGTNDWVTSSAVGDGRANPILQIALIPGAWTEKVLPAHTLNCRNCGYIKFFSAQIVGEWIANNG